MLRATKRLQRAATPASASGQYSRTQLENKLPTPLPPSPTPHVRTRVSVKMDARSARLKKRGAAVAAVEPSTSAAATLDSTSTPTRATEISKKAEGAGVDPSLVTDAVADTPPPQRNCALPSSAADPSIAGLASVAHLLPLSMADRATLLVVSASLRAALLIKLSATGAALGLSTVRALAFGDEAVHAKQWGLEMLVMCMERDKREAREAGAALKSTKWMKQLLREPAGEAHWKLVPVTFTCNSRKYQRCGGCGGGGGGGGGGDESGSGCDVVEVKALLGTVADHDSSLEEWLEGGDYNLGIETINTHAAGLLLTGAGSVSEAMVAVDLPDYNGYDKAITSRDVWRTFGRCGRVDGLELAAAAARLLLDVSLAADSSICRAKAASGYSGGEGEDEGDGALHFDLTSLASVFDDARAASRSLDGDDVKRATLKAGKAVEAGVRVCLYPSTPENPDGYLDIIGEDCACLLDIAKAAVKAATGYAALREPGCAAAALLELREDGGAAAQGREEVTVADSRWADANRAFVGEVVAELGRIDASFDSPGGGDATQALQKRYELLAAVKGRLEAMVTRYLRDGRMLVTEGVSAEHHVFKGSYHDSPTLAQTVSRLCDDLIARMTSRDFAKRTAHLAVKVLTNAVEDYRTRNRLSHQQLVDERLAAAARKQPPRRT
jgi:hypothetical protein